MARYDRIHTYIQLNQARGPDKDKHKLKALKDRQRRQTIMTDTNILIDTSDPATSAPLWSTVVTELCDVLPVRDLYHFKHLDTAPPGSLLSVQALASLYDCQPWTELLNA